MIEKEVGAEGGLTDVRRLLEDRKIFESSAASTRDNIFSRAMHKHSNIFKIRTPPKIITAYLSDMSGMLFCVATRDKSDLDPDIFSGMLSAVSNFVNDSIQQWSGKSEEQGSGGLDALSYKDDKLGNLTIRICRGSFGVLIVTYKGDISKDIERDIQETVDWVEEHHSGELKNWDGDTDADFLYEIKRYLYRTFLESGRYDGKFDMETLMENKEEIKDNLVEKVNEQTGEFVFLFDDIQYIDPLSLELLSHLLHNTTALIICQYEIDLLEEDLENEGFKKLIEDTGRCRKISIRSNVDIEELIRSKLKGVDEDSLKLLKYAAVADSFDTEVLTRALKSNPKKINKVVNNLENVGIVKNDRFANSRLRTRAMEYISRKEQKMIDLRIAAAMIKIRDESNNIRIAELLLPYADSKRIIRKKAVKYSIDAGDELLRKFDIDRATEFYNQAITLDTNEKRKHSLLEKTLILESLTWK